MIGRRGLLATLAGTVVAGCTKVAQSAPGGRLLGAVEDWNRRIQRALAHRTALAREFPPADISPSFRGNGTLDPGTLEYAMHQAGGFAGWALAVDGLNEALLAKAAEALVTRCEQRMANPAGGPGHPDDLTFVLLRQA